jgi:hypothetical protein
MKRAIGRDIFNALSALPLFATAPSIGTGTRGGVPPTQSSMVRCLATPSSRGRAFKATRAITIDALPDELDE